MDDNFLKLYLQKKQEEVDTRRAQQLTVPEEMERHRREDWNNANPLERFITPSMIPEYIRQKYPEEGLFPNVRRYFNTAPEFKKGMKLDE